MSGARDIAAILILAASVAGALSVAGAECAACNGGSVSYQQSLLDKEWISFLEGENAATIEEAAAGDSGLLTPLKSRQNHIFLKSLQWENSSPASEEIGMSSSQERKEERRAKRSETLRSLDDANDSNDSRIILDISPEPSEYIPGAISIAYTEFLLPGGALKPVMEMAEVLGETGISQDDEVLIYGECQPCGGGPSAATYVYWIMRYLGHRNLSLLDGGIDDWVLAGEPTAANSSYLPPVNYTPEVRSDLLASYQFVQSGSAQIIDARSAEEYEAGSIPGSVNIPYGRVLDGKKIKDDESLQGLFSSLDRERPVVVYTNTGVKASMIWLALTMLDYDASIYTWKDWQANAPEQDPAPQET